MSDKISRFADHLTFSLIHDLMWAFTIESVCAANQELYVNIWICVTFVMNNNNKNGSFYHRGQFET